jgi:hypothetical protein
MLMYAISLELQWPTCVIIHNQCLNTKLISPVYFGNSVVCPELSCRQIDIDTEMSASFEISATQCDFEGALLFKLQRCSDSQYNMNTLNIKSDENEEKCFQMFVAWKVKDYKPFVHVTLVEHTQEFTWDKNELKKLYHVNCGYLKEYDTTITDTWLIDDNMTLEAAFKTRSSKGSFELNISISEVERDDYAMRPLCIDHER